MWIVATYIEGCENLISMLLVIIFLCEKSILLIQRSQPGIETTSLLWFCSVLSVYVYTFYLNLDKEFWKSFSQMTGSGIQT